MARELLPAATVVLRCDECGGEIVALDCNTPRLVTELSRRRREHAIRAHGWPFAPRGLAEAPR